MTISYNSDVASSSWYGFIRILFRWRGSIWQSVFIELTIWIVLYYIIGYIYLCDWILSPSSKEFLEGIYERFKVKIDFIPLGFMLGFFVSFVTERWKKIYANVGWVESTALFVSTYVRGESECERIQRRNIIRYLCVAQVIVYRDISLRVKRRFPTLQSVAQAGYLFPDELEEIEKFDVNYSRYFVPINWVFSMVYKMRKSGAIEADILMNCLLQEIRQFRHNLAQLCRYDWVPVPLAYSQVVILAVRLYFFLCLVIRQNVLESAAKKPTIVDLGIPFMTLMQFIFYMGWMKVAEALLNPLGEDEDDLELNYVIDRNLDVGMRIVDSIHDFVPLQRLDNFSDGNGAMYSVESVKEPVHQMIGSAAGVKVKNEKDVVVMVPREHLRAGSPLESNRNLTRRKTVGPSSQAWRNPDLKSSTTSVPEALLNWKIAWTNSQLMETRQHNGPAENKDLYSEMRLLPDRSASDTGSHISVITEEREDSDSEANCYVDKGIMFLSVKKH